MAEQRYQAVLAVIADGLGVSRQTLHAWLARYEAEGLEGLKDRSHRPDRCPHQMGALARIGVRGGWCLSWASVAWVRCRWLRRLIGRCFGPE